MFGQPPPSNWAARFPVPTSNHVASHQHDFQPQQPHQSQSTWPTNPSVYSANRQTTSSNQSRAGGNLAVTQFETNYNHSIAVGYPQLRPHFDSGQQPSNGHRTRSTEGFHLAQSSHSSQGRAAAFNLAPSFQSHSEASGQAPFNSGSGTVSPAKRYPDWVFQSNRLPPIYRDVLYFAMAPDGRHLDTSKLYSVLMTSQLAKPVLGHLWSLVNKETAGILSVPECTMLLALVALAQSNRLGQNVNNISFLYQLRLDATFPAPRISLPYFHTPANTVDQKRSSVHTERVPSCYQNASNGGAPSYQRSSAPIAVQQEVLDRMSQPNSSVSAELERRNQSDHPSHSHCSCTESSSDQVVEDLEEDGGVVYIAEELFYSGSDSAAESYQSSSSSSPAHVASNRSSPKHLDPSQYPRQRPPQQQSTTANGNFNSTVHPKVPLSTLVASTAGAHCQWELANTQQSGDNFDVEKDDFADFESAPIPASNTSKGMDSAGLGQPNSGLAASERERESYSSNSTLSSHSAPFFPDTSASSKTDKLRLPDKNLWFQQFQQVEPPLPKEDDVPDDDDFADFQNFTSVVTSNNSETKHAPRSFPENTANLNNQSVVDKYAVFRELAIESTETDYAFLQNGSVKDDGTVDDSDSKVLQTTTSMPSSNILKVVKLTAEKKEEELTAESESVQQMSSTEVVSEGRQLTVTENQDDDAEWAEFESFSSATTQKDSLIEKPHGAVGETKGDNFDGTGIESASSECSQLDVKKEVDAGWADFASFSTNNQSSDKPTESGDHSDDVVEKVDITGEDAIEEDCDWTEFADEGSQSGNRDAFSGETAAAPDVSGLIWSKAQVSADGLYDRIKQTILAEDVRKPALSEDSTKMKMRSSDVSQSVGENVGVERQFSDRRRETAKTVSSAERYLGLHGDFEMSDGTRQKRVWEKVLRQCEDILKTIVQTVDEIEDDELKCEVVGSRQWSGLCTGAVLVFGVAIRIQHSFECAKLFDNEISKLFSSIELTWNLFTPLLPKQLLSSEMFESSTDRNVLPPVAKFGAEACGVCLLQIEEVPSSSYGGNGTGSTKETASHMRENISSKKHFSCISFGGRNYHTPCANLWVNKVDLVLPSLLLIDVL